MALTAKQTSMILRFLSHQLSGERDIVKISMLLQEFQGAFESEIPNWRTELSEYLKKEPYGYTALTVLKKWA